jgi:hypothetical protein
MQKQQRHPMDISPAASIHRMLKSDALPSHLLSVIDSSGHLTGSPDELKAVMAVHFQSVFAIPRSPASASPLPASPPPPLLLDKPSVDPSWYVGLVADVQGEELLELLRSVPLISAPGQDEVSSGVWKAALQISRSISFFFH